MEHFSPEVEAQLQYYVYALVDPRTEKIFYVGKGTGNRVFQHIAEAEATTTDNPKEKIEQIRAIHATKGADGKPLEVKHYIVRHGLTEDTAYEVESTLINLLTYDAFKDQTIGSLTNIQSGVGEDERGIATTEQIIREHGATEIDLQQVADAMKLNFIAINIRLSYSNNSTTDEIYEATRGSWNLNFEHANNADYAIAIYRGIVVGAFYCRGRWEIDTTKSSYDEPGFNRLLFSQPQQLPPTIKKQLEQLREKIEGKRIPTVKGAKNPIKYIDCNK